MEERLTREEFEDMLVGVEKDYLGLQTLCIKAVGPTAGVLARQAVYWTDRSRLEDGFFYKSREEMQEETGLSFYAQKKAKKILAAKGVLEEKRPSRRKPAHYRINLLRLAQLLGLIESDDYTRTTESDDYSGTTESDDYTRTTESDDYSEPLSSSAIGDSLHRVPTKTTGIDDRHREPDRDSVLQTATAPNKKDGNVEGEKEPTPNSLDRQQGYDNIEDVPDFDNDDHPLNCLCSDCSARLPKYARPVRHFEEVA